MALIADVEGLFSEWIAAVTSAIDGAAGRLLRSPRILLHESEDGTFTATAIESKSTPALAALSFGLVNGRPNPPLPEAWVAAFRGSRVEAELPSSQVMESPLDFPSRAGDFLDGMVRSQVDRLTPWSVNDAVFGWSPPTATANGRIQMTLAATAKSRIQPLLRLTQTLEAASVAIYAIASTSAGSARIKLLDQPLQAATGARLSLPILLRNGLLGLGAAAAASLLIAAYLESAMQSQQSDLEQQILQRRAALRQDSNAPGSGVGLLAKRKQTTPSSIMVLESISRALPDTTYVTELRIEDDKVQIVGMTQDAPSLVRLIEQSPQFTRATFFAPTTHAANEAGERFHIEAHIAAYFGTGT
jgi:general secretion pathway protein L